jgi:hypothetical protein
MNMGIDAELVARQLGNDGVDHLVTDAERICGHEEKRIALMNEPFIVRLQAEGSIVMSEAQRIAAILEKAPPAGNLRRLRCRAIFYWLVAILLAVSGFFGTLLSLAPFRLGWMGWLIAAGMAVLTPFLVDYLLERPRMERVLTALTAVAATASLATVMLLALVRGELLGEQMRQSEASAIILDDAPQQAETPNTFYDRTTAWLRLALFLMAFAMEAGAGLVLHAAWRSAPDDSEDWVGFRRDRVRLLGRLAQITYEITMLRNEPAVFVAQFWRDFYRALLLKATDSAVKRMLGMFIVAILFTGIHVRAEDRVNLVVAIDLTRSVATAGPDGKSEYQKNVDGVGRLLAKIPAGSRITVIGITDHSFTQPYVLLSARVSDDPGYFGERLNATRSQLVRTWVRRAAHLDPGFRETDIFGALHLASQILSGHRDVSRNVLVIFSDMRQSTSCLDLESIKAMPSMSAVAHQCGESATLDKVQTYVVGVDGAGKPTEYWQSLKNFWQAFFQNARADLRTYTVLRDSAISRDLENDRNDADDPEPKP